MKLYLQMGHGMMSMCKELSEVWGGATVILSPQNIYPTDKLAPYATSLRNLNGRVLFDPQLYSPRKYHKNLEQHIYWSQDSATKIALGDCQTLLSTLADINAQIESEAFILPSSIIDKIDARWGKVQGVIASQARSFAINKQTLLTVALGKDVLADETQVEAIIQYADKWDADGIYLVCEHPDKRYLVDNPIWVANLLSLVAGIKRLNKTVIVGYANHQMLPLSLAKCDAIASGNFLNVRWFKPEHFETVDNDEMSRRTTWYYCPQTLSEFKVTYLDVAKRNGVLNIMATPTQMQNEYSQALFGGAVPSSTSYKEPHSFKHYLHCLKIQCEQVTKATYVASRDSLFAQLETAAQILDGLHSERIKGQDRDFREIIDANEAAIQTFDKDFHFVMSQEWT